MGMRSNREIFYDSPLDFIKHVTGKDVLSWRRCYDKLGFEVFFADQTYCYISESAPIEWNKIEYLKIPKSICVSCGQDMHASTIDWKGRCSITVQAFWANVRKIFWHRYATTSQK